jgi:hypothetical protein
MEILRLPPYPIVTTWDVPAADTDYTVQVEDVVDHTIEITTVTSNADSQIIYELPREKVQFDRDFSIRILDENDLIVTDSNLTVYRPYVDPNMLATTGTASEIAEYKRLEIIARSIIDSYLGNDSATGEGFYNHKLVVQGIGDGTDYYPMWHNVKRILKVYENNELVYDIDTASEWPTQYIIAANNSAIMKVESGIYNRNESKPLQLPRGYGDIGPYGGGGSAFQRGSDYIFILDVGYKAVPPDVEIATTMLIDDIKCNRNEYYQKFVTEYKTDQFNIKFDKQMLEGTGNLVVDKILNGYKGTVFKPGIF